MNRVTRCAPLALIAAVLWLGTGCLQTADVEPPKETIVVNMNVKIDDAIRVAVEKDLDALFESEKGIF